jgi:uncharacterized protein affecting Mg2+/Co2+ transport
MPTMAESKKYEIQVTVETEYLPEQSDVAEERFVEYTSGCALTTPVGTMRGSYQMVADDGTQFDAEIPEFVLSMPRVLH